MFEARGTDDKYSSELPSKYSERERENIHLRDHIAQNEVTIADRERDGELNTYCRLHEPHEFLQCNRE